MKKLFTTSFLFIIQFSFCQFSVNPILDINIDYGKVKSTSKVSKINIIEYKNIINFSELDSIQKLELIEKELNYMFDKYGNIITFNDSEYGETNLEYNNENKLISYKNASDEKVKIEYLKDSENINEYYYNYESEIKYQKIIKNIIKNNFLIKATIFSNNGSIEREDEYKYNSKNDVVFSKVYGVITNYTYLYNSKGYMTKKSSLNNYKKGGSEIFKYDEKNRVIENQNLDLNNIIRSKVNYIYDENLLSKEIWNYYRNGKKTSTEITEYQYDKNGNWTIKNRILNEIPNTIIYRKIEYK